MIYDIRYEVSVRKDAAALSTPALRRLRSAIEKRLATDPIRFGKPLQGSWKGHRRLSVGDYRAIYRVDENIRAVYIVALGHRKDIYDD